MTMTHPGSSIHVSPRRAWRLAVLGLLSITLGVLVLFAAYFLVPTRSAGQGSNVPWLFVALGVFTAVAAVQIPAIVRAPYPVVRAVGTMAILVSLYLIVFARLYLSISLGDPGAFSRPLDTTTALYFTVTVFATVGFGDIVAQINSMRLLVTFQMLLNLVVLGTLIRLIATAAQHGVARRRSQPDTSQP
jgi:voltage-gated potassium channel